MLAKRLFFILFFIVSIQTISFNPLNAQDATNIKAIETIEVAGCSGVAIYKQGLVYVKRANSEYWQQVELYTKFYPLDTIQTDKKGVCEIKLYGDHVLRIEPSSNFSFAERNPGIDKWAAFKLNAGKVWVKVINSAPNSGSFILETPLASISVKGTVFSVEAPHGRIVAYDGILQVTQQNLEITINAGEQTKINQYGFMTTPEAIDAEGVSVFEELEKNVKYLTPKDIQTIKSKVINPIKTKLKNKIKQNNEQKTATAHNINSEKSIDNADNDLFDIEDDIQKQNNELLISKNKTISILEDSLLYRNPAILSKIPVNRMNTVYYEARSDSSILNYNSKHSDNSYINDPSQVNAGANGRIEENQILGVRTLERDMGVDVYFKKQRYIQMIGPAQAELYQNNILSFFYGKAFQIENKTSLGLLLRSSIITSTKEDKTTFLSPFASSFGAGTDKAFFCYALDLGLLHSLTPEFSLGLSYQGLFANETLGFEDLSDNNLYLTGIFFNEQQTTELSIKSHKSNTALIINSIFQLSELPILLFTTKAELANKYSLYSLITNLKTSDTFQLFLKLTVEQMKEIADNRILILGGQLDF
ncbi:MAG: FecR family protein [Candidatus Margulisbacteria bacterium]|nr:FecR family protein [Candidatus Margulisiibacteriota bacterium]